MFVKGFHYLGESKGDRPLPAVEDQNDLIVKQEYRINKGIEQFPTEFRFADVSTLKVL